jgi:hypothetical protein
MAHDPFAELANFVINPTDGSTGVARQMTLKFNCDLFSGAIRTNYIEQQYAMRFIVNTVTVYESLAYPNLWSTGTGGSRHTNSPTTPGHSVGIWYTLTSGQAADLDYSTEYTISVDLKPHDTGTWEEVINASITTTEEPTPPLAPINPAPANDATVVNTTHVLAWEDGGSGEYAATSYDVYFNGELIDTVATTTIDLEDYSPVILDPDTEYAWRIDAHNDDGTTTGTTWYFLTVSENVPEQPSSPSPSNGATNVTFGQAMLSWVDPGAGTEKAATSFAVRIGLHNDESMIEVAEGPETTVAIGVVLLPTLFYWRVDATNSYGTTTGNTWTFTVDDDPLRNKQDDGAWHPGGSYTVEVYAPDSNIDLILSSNDSLDATGEIQNVTFGVLRRLDSQWAVYNVTIPFDCDTGDFYLKWNYNDE